MLAISELTKVYDQRHGLRDVSVAVGEGEFLSIVGRSGCGKSTLLKLVAGLIRADTGTVLLDGKAIRPGCGGAAIVFQQPTLLPWRSVRSNVELGLESERLSGAERRARAVEALTMVGLDGFAATPPYRLSGGMQQRVGVARALAVRPRILLMDEPFASVDDFTRETLRSQLLALWGQLKMTVLFVTHDIDEAIYLGNRVCVLGSSPGRVLKVLEVPFAHPRDDAEIRHLAAGRNLRSEIVDLLQPADRSVPDRKIPLPEETIEIEEVSSQ